jgi:hypothetical protein
MFYRCRLRVAFAAFIVALFCATAVLAQTLGGACPAVNTSTSIGNSSMMNNLFCIGGVWVLETVQPGAATAPCAAGTAGQIQWTGAALQYCNGSSWNSLSGGSSTITLGTSASATNPQRSSEAGTGFYSASDLTASVAANGIEVEQWNTLGSGVDYLSVTPGKSGTAPKIAVAGSTSPQHLNLAPVGIAGVVQFNGGTMFWQDVTNQNDVVGASNFPSTVTTGTGQYDLAVGNLALNSNTSGYGNTAVGISALQSVTTGYNNTATGYDALLVSTGTGNSVFGDAAGLFATGNYNTLVGLAALEHSNASNNNVAVGVATLQNDTGGGYNTVVGTSAGNNISTGAQNTLLGDAVGSSTLTTGSYNILIGTDITTDATSSSASNTMNIGNTIYGTNLRNGNNSGGNGYIGVGTAAPAEPLEIYSSGSGVLLQLAGSSGTCNHTPGSSSETVSCSSDMRLKSDAIDAPSALLWLSSIRVRDFTWKNTGQKRTGVIAQELQETHPEMVTYNRGTDEWTVEQPNPWTLVKLLQEQQAEIDDLKKQLATKH